MQDFHSVFLICKMKESDGEVLSIFEETGALLKGHFILRSGLRSEYFFQCAQVCQHLNRVTRLAELLIEQISKSSCFDQIDVVVAPAMGGLVVGQEIARQIGARYIFLEKVDDKLALRRNFSLASNERVILVEDVITKGGRAKEAIDIIRQYPCTLLGAISLVDRSVEELDFGVPFESLLKMSFPTYGKDELPDRLQAITPIKPGS